MPSASGKQHRLMELVAHNPQAAKRLGIKQSVGEDFVKADKAEGKHFKRKKRKVNPHKMTHDQFMKL